MTSTSGEEKICRICFEQLGKNEGIQPCKCTGSQAYVHVECVKEWITTRGMHKCNVCKAEYTGLNLRKTPKSFLDWLKDDTEALLSLIAAVFGFGFLFYVHLIGFLQYFTSGENTNGDEQVGYTWRFILLVLVSFYTFLTIVGLVWYILKTFLTFRAWKSTHFKITWPDEAQNA